MSFLDYLNKKEQEKIEQNPEKPKKKIDIVEHNEDVEETQETKPPHPYKETVDYAGYVLEQAENMEYDVHNQRSKNTQANDDLDHAEMLL